MISKFLIAICVSLIFITTANADSFVIYHGNLVQTFACTRVDSLLTQSGGTVNAMCYGLTSSGDFDSIYSDGFDPNAWGGGIEYTVSLTTTSGTRIYRDSHCSLNVQDTNNHQINLNISCGEL